VGFGAAAALVAAGCVGCAPPLAGAHAAASAINAVALAPRSSVRRFSPTPSRTNRPLPKTTGASAPQLGTPQSDGPQWDGGLAVSSGLMIFPAITSV